MSLSLRVRRFVNGRLGLRRRRLAARRLPPLCKSWPEFERAQDGGYTLLLGGDVHFEGGLRKGLSESSDLLAGLAPLLGQADASVLNLETAIATGGTAERKQFTFHAPPVALEALAKAGASLLSMANNHGMDFGQDGLRETLDAVEASRLPVIGIGRDAAAAYAPAMLEVRGQRLAVVAATDVFDPGLEEAWTATGSSAGLASSRTVEPLLGAIRAARAEADTVLAYLHWGEAGSERATRRQRQLAALLTGGGADIVAGCHSHRPQSAGWLGRAFVCYGLGNAVWWRPGPSPFLALGVRGREVLSYRWVAGWRHGQAPQPVDPRSAGEYVRYIQRNVARDGLRT